MTLAGILIGIYGLATLVGGLIGYLKAGSAVSLIVGAASGIILLASSYFVAKGARWAATITLTISVLIGARFAIAFAKSGTLMPHLLIIALSLVGVIASAAVFTTVRSDQKTTQL